jgi:hypothetical protein
MRRTNLILTLEARGYNGEETLRRVVTLLHERL